jgi:hypothetical protein
MSESLCESCGHLREVISAEGSRFPHCLLAQSDSRFPKYPPQPVLRCGGYKPRPNGDDKKPTFDTKGGQSPGNNTS